jgi:hypothetical protein
MDKETLQMLENKTKELLHNEIKPNSELLCLVDPKGNKDFIIDPRKGWIFVRKTLLQNTKNQPQGKT